MKKFFTIMLASILLLTGCAGAGTAAAYAKISALEAKEIIESGDSYILLDVRTQEEYDSGHIEGSILLPYTEIEQLAPEKLPDKDATILVYCRSGRRSAIASQALADMGYTHVSDMGGIQDWPYGGLVTG
jgi:rhodanese-related sulfurtransferase